MSIRETEKKINPSEDNLILEGDFDIVPHGQTNTPWKRHILSLILFILVAGASFGLGRVAFLENNKVPVTIRSSSVSSLPADTLVDSANLANSSQITQQTTDASKDGLTNASSPSSSNSINTQSTVVASKAGTKYHYPWCPGAKQISSANKITFNTIDEARKAGYTPAANCKGLK